MNDYERFGALVCFASNGIMNVKTIERYIDNLSRIGYNTLEICIDDLYKIDEEPYFGYLRGGYTREEIREIDSYAKSKGIELVPNIQTLAHLTNLVKLPEYQDIVDIDNIIMVDDERTYALIDHMFKALRDAFSTNVINIGFDEAHHVGLGKYLDKHGYTNRMELLIRHLNKVNEIANKYGFRCHMWSDMFFRLKNNGEYYGKNQNVDLESMKKIADNIDVVYWDYYNLDEEIYDSMFESHEKFNKNLWFAGGAWCWCGFSPLYDFTYKTMVPAMKQVIKHNVKNVIITCWGDDGNSLSFFSTIPALYMIRQFSLGNFDMDSIKDGFEKIFNLKYDDFMALELNSQTNYGEHVDWIACPSMSLFYNDPFLGIKDSALSKVSPRIPYEEYAKTLNGLKKDKKEFEYLFDVQEKLALFLEKKAYIGLDARKYYRANDKKGLENVREDLLEASRRLLDFRKVFHDEWMLENKAFGWEIQEIRLGGLYFRLNECADRIRLYLDEKIDKIDELEEDILPFGQDKLDINLYRSLVSRSEL